MIDRVFLVCSGDGTDGKPWEIEYIHRTKEGAERRIETGGYGYDIYGERFSLEWYIEEWKVYE